MSKQFTVITKDGSKWLRARIPHDFLDSVEFVEFPYMGSHPEGTTLDESEVREVRQGFCEYTMKWITEYDDDLPTYNRYRTAYTDAKSHDIDYEKEMPHKQWPSTKYVARKVGSTPFNTQNVRPLVDQLVGEEISFSRFVELLNEIANTR